jgi:hypothetical protein
MARSAASTRWLIADSRLASNSFQRFLAHAFKADALDVAARGFGVGYAPGATGFASCSCCISLAIHPLSLSSPRSACQPLTFVPRIIGKEFCRNWPLDVLMYTTNDRQVVTPQLRRLAGRHARYFDLQSRGSQLGACREMRSVSARESP